MDVESLAKQLILKGMTEEQQKAILDSIKTTMTQARTLQKQRVGENVQVVVQALKKLEADIRERYDEVGNKIEKRVATIKDGKDGLNGSNGKDGKDGRPGRDGGQGPRGADGLNGNDGRDGTDGVSVTDAHIDFDGSLIISLSSGRTINVGEVVAPDLAEKIKVITNGGGTSQVVLDTLASLQTQIDNLIPSQTGNAGKFLTTNGSALSWAQVAGGLSYQGTWNASTNTPTLVSGTGSNGYYYVVSTAGSTNLDGITDWQIGDWLLFNGTAWQKIDQSNLVTSVNGQTGAVSLSTTNISEGTNQYFTDARARAAISAGSGISYNNTTGVVTNAAPDQTVVLTGSGTTTVTGTYPNFTISSADSNVGTVTSVGITAGTGVTVSGSPITTSGNISVGLSAKLTAIENLSGAGFITQNGSGNIARRTIQAGTGISVAHGNGSSQDPIITNSAPDQTVVLTGSGTTTVTGTYPNFTIASADSTTGTVTSVGGTGTVNGISLSGTVTSSGNLTLGGALSGVDLTTQVTGTLPIANGGTGQTTANTAFNALAPSQTSNSGKYLTTDGTNSSWAAIVSGASLSNDTTTATNLYPLFAAATTGTPTTVYTSDAQYLFKPSTGELSVRVPRASNGIVVNSATISSDYTIATGDNGMSAGPVSVDSGVTVTVSSGSTWVVV
jgi:hypothetical protein